MDKNKEMPSSTDVLYSALINKSAMLSEAALSDHGLNDDVYHTYSRNPPTISQKALLIARLHELLIADGGKERVEAAVRDGRLRTLLGRNFLWVLPLFEAET